MKRVIISLFAGLLLLAMACTYTNSEFYYATPIPGDSASINVSTNLDTVDPISIKDSLLFKYRAEINNGKLYLANASISSYTLYQFYPEYDPDTLMAPYVLVDSFWIWSDLASDTGVYPMLLEFYYSSNTNSLGDVLGLEADILELNFDLILEGGKK